MSERTKGIQIRRLLRPSLLYHSECTHMSHIRAGDLISLRSIGFRWKIATEMSECRVLG